MNFLVIAYYTENTIYEAHAQKFVKSLEKFSIPHFIKSIPNFGDWYKNTGYKPTFIKECLELFAGINLVYVDVDAEFMRCPDLFETLDCNIGVHYFDRRNHPKINVELYEVLSGTIFLQNNKEVFDIVCRWEERCKKFSYVWDQKSLEFVLEGEFFNLPEEYCVIFDVMNHVKNPVIVHYQASRELRKHGSLRVVSGALSKEVS